MITVKLDIEIAPGGWSEEDETTNLTVTHADYSEHALADALATFDAVVAKTRAKLVNLVAE